MNSQGLTSLYLAIILTSAAACSKTEESENLRQSKATELLSKGSGNINPKSPDLKTDYDFPSLSFSETQAFEGTLVPADIVLINKISPTETIFFEKSGNSWHYTEGQGKPIFLKAEVAAQDYQVYLLPDKNFWRVNSKEINYNSRDKEPVENPDGSVQLKAFTFQTEQLESDCTGLTVLYVSKDDILVQCKNAVHHVALGSGPSNTKTPFAIDKLPAKVEGPLSAGRTSNNGFWFRSAGGLSLVVPDKEGKGLVFKLGQLISAFEPLEALWLDTDAVKAVGESFVIKSSVLLSTAPNEAPAAE